MIPPLLSTTTTASFSLELLFLLLMSLFFVGFFKKDLGLFDFVKVSMDVAEDGSLDETDVTITVKEKNWYKLETGATTGGKQQSALDASEFSNLR